MCCLCPLSAFESEMLSWIFVTETCVVHKVQDGYLANMCKMGRQYLLPFDLRHGILELQGMWSRPLLLLVRKLGARESLTFSVMFYWGGCGWLPPPHPEDRGWNWTVVTFSSATDSCPPWQYPVAQVTVELRFSLPSFPVSLMFFHVSCLAACLHLRFSCSVLICYWVFTTL